MASAEGDSQPTAASQGGSPEKKYPTSLSSLVSGSDPNRKPESLGSCSAVSSLRVSLAGGQQGGEGWRVDLKGKTEDIHNHSYSYSVSLKMLFVIEHVAKQQWFAFLTQQGSGGVRL